MQRAMKLKNIKIAAICDVWDVALQKAKELASGNVETYTDYHKILDRKDYRCRDHWYVSMTVDACQAGKDVYVEKPLTHSLTSMGDHFRTVGVWEIPDTVQILLHYPKNKL